MDIECGKPLALMLLAWFCFEVSVPRYSTISSGSSSLSIQASTKGLIGSPNTVIFQVLAIRP